MAEQEERTEQATPRKRQQAREKGQVARSRELGPMAATAGVIAVFYFAGPSMIYKLSTMTGKFLSLSYGTEPIAVTKQAAIGMFYILIPFLGLAFVLALGTGFAQGGLIIKPLGFEMEKLNPISGIQRLFSLNGFIELGKSLFKFMLGGAVLYAFIEKAFKVLPATQAMGMGALQKTAFSFVSKAVLDAFGIFLVIAFADYAVEKFKFERSLRMSKEEIKQEYRESEGDPVIKSRIKSLRREAARKRMMQEVPKATVVITNPTHLAVALLYDRESTPAPKIIAKGAGHIAARIKEIAAEHGVPIVEDKPVARALFKQDVNSYIPEELYKVVAKIIAYVFKLKRKV
ncbi:MAG: EscU/YscU/HrcU family type III secretion system export apparatus switch protein [Nitrospiraceae bacterium]|nr:EscU/YscU/HrcU family type III secretion system export apparatus switch protein [Nitrospiraceae bacterium]MDA8090856.1 EscU/YscU/HrcU family type III secretion system export apparatus switch protein [Nitrospiraceae bacterium]